MNIYIFTSERLGFRNWQEEDITTMTEINNDPDVMAFFPGLLNEEQTTAFVQRMMAQYENKGFCYFAVDELATGNFIGFIGLSEQSYEAAFTPCVDIGWRLHSISWNRGFASEGAKRCLEYAFNELRLDEIYAIAPKINIKSEKIMQKIGMQKQYEFDHPFLADNTLLKKCNLYKISRPHLEPASIDKGELK
ncbi:MAG: GNAT family N-acetyltransferase [Saprospiraceae bacterium]|nr:GNAT family N-acetyltransferase [Saprospiraceae bacterium]